MGRASAELKPVFPLGKSPVLVVDSGGGWLPRVASLTDNYAQGNWESISPTKSIMNASKSLQIALLQ